jgi:Mg2+/Co2+ transporter CorC
MRDWKKTLYGNMTDEEIEQMHRELAEAEEYEENLRDEFAKAAITGILAGRWGQMPHRKPEDAFADFAYRVADAMLRRRVQDEPTE